MPKHQSRRRLGVILQRYGLLFAVVPALVIGVGWVVANLQFQAGRSEEIDRAFNHAQRDSLYSRIREVEEFSRYLAEATRMAVEDEIRHRVDEAHDIAEHLYHSFSGDYPNEIVQSMIVESLRPLRFLDGRGYYFITDFDGIERLFADHPEFEGTDMIDVRDADGHYVIRDMISIARTSGAGYYEYLWTRPDHEGNKHPKIAYIRRFDPYNWFIGTGEYLDDTEKAVEERLLERITQMSWENGGYVFAIDENGIVLHHQITDFVGRDNDAVLEESQFTEITRIPDTRGGEYVKFSWIDARTGEEETRLSYAVVLEPWGWTVGTNVEIGSTESLIQNQLGELTRTTLVQAGVSVVVILVSLLVAVLLVRRISGRLGGQVVHIERGLQEASGRLNSLDPGPLVVEELYQIAGYINRLIATRREAERELRWHDIVVSNTGEAVMVTDSRGTVLTVNRAFIRTTGYSRQEVLGRSYLTFFHDEREGMLDSVRRVMEGLGYWRGELPMRRGDGALIPVEADLTLVREDDGSASHLVVIFRDISERKNRENALMKELEHDAVTGIANRRAFDQTVAALFDAVDHSRRSLSLLMIDIDHFKIYNDNLGHLRGDECLKIVGSILEKGLRRKDEKVFRYGGEEFAVLLPGQALRSAIRVGLRLRNAVREASIPHKGRPGGKYLTISVGIATLIPRTSSIEELIETADKALYIAKRSGRDHVKVAYSSEDDALGFGEEQ